MNFEQLETFVWLARLQSFRAVADKLNTSQPGVSLRIQRLEEDLGAPLFDRTRRAAALTAFGRECLAFAEQIMAWKQELRDRASAAGPARGRVNLGVSELIAHTWLSDLLATLAARHPGIQISPTIDLTPKLLLQLEAGDFDVVLVGSHSLATTHPVLDLGAVAYRWMGRPDRISAGAHGRPLSPRELQAHQIITWPKDAAIHWSIMEWFAGHGAYPERQITCNSALTMAAMAAAGLGVSLLPAEVVGRELSEGRLVVVPVEPEIAPLQYKAVYVQRRGSLGAIVAKTAQEITAFR